MGWQVHGKLSSVFAASLDFDQDTSQKRAAANLASFGVQKKVRRHDQFQVGTVGSSTSEDSGITPLNATTKSGSLPFIGILHATISRGSAVQPQKAFFHVKRQYIWRADTLPPRNSRRKRLRPNDIYPPPPTWHKKLCVYLAENYIKKQTSRTERGKDESRSCWLNVWTFTLRSLSVLFQKCVSCQKHTLVSGRQMVTTGETTH